MDHDEYAGDHPLNDHDEMNIASEPEQQLIKEDSQRSRIEYSGVDNTFQEKSISRTPTDHDEINIELSHVKDAFNEDLDLNTDNDQYKTMHTDNDVENNGFGKEPTSSKKNIKSQSKQRSMFGNAFKRCIYFASSLFIFSILSFALWFFNVDTDLAAGFGISAFGSLVIFFGALAAILLTILHHNNLNVPFQWILMYITVGLYIISGIIYFIGGCALAQAYNSSGIYDSSYAGIWFAESFYIGAHAIIAGIDLWKQWMDSKGLRVFLYGILYFCVSLVLFFCYAIQSNINDGASAPGLIACGYFFGMIIIAGYVSTRICQVTCIKKYATPTVDLIFAIALLISIAFSVIGYWGMSSKTGISEFSAYWVGYSFFLALMGTQIAIDIKWSGYPDTVLQYHQ